MLNMVAIQGRIVKDIELKVTSTGKSVCAFTLACDRNRKDSNGNRPTDWIDCIAWGTTAEFVSKYFHKGDMTAIEGHLQTRTYEDKGGTIRKVTEVIVEEASFCSKREQPHSDDTFQELPDEDEFPWA